MGIIILTMKTIIFTAFAAMASAGKNCIIGRISKCKANLADAMSSLVSANTSVLKMPDDCAGSIAACTADIEKLETGITETISDINGAIDNCFDNPIFCTNNVVQAGVDIVAAIDGLTSATNDCSPPDALTFLI